MYNSDRKNRFIDTLQLRDDRRVWAENIFNTTEKMEEELGMDIAMFSADDVGAALCSTGSTSSVTIVNRIPFIVRYKKWCSDNDMDTLLIDSSDVKFDFTENIRNSMVYSPSHLMEIIDKAFDCSKEQYASMTYVYRAYLWLAFSGMPETDAVEVSERDINLKDRVIAVNGRWYEIRQQGVDDIKAAMKVSDVTHIMKDGSVRVFRRADGDKLVRGRKLRKEVSPRTYIMQTLRHVICVAMAAIGHDAISYIKIQKSGIFYTMLEREVRGFVPNFYTIACDEYDRGNHKTTSADVRRRTIARSNMNYNRDYAAWKKAFSKELRKEFGVHKLP